jgi:hypothetical protein
MPVVLGDPILLSEDEPLSFLIDGVTRQCATFKGDIGCARELLPDLRLVVLVDGVHRNLPERPEMLLKLFGCLTHRFNPCPLEIGRSTST